MALRLLTSVFGCGWLGWKWVATWKIKAKCFKLFPGIFKKINIYSLRLISIHKFSPYLPLDVQLPSCQALISEQFRPKTSKIPWRSSFKFSTSCKFMVSFMYVTFFSSSAFICFLMSDNSSVGVNKLFLVWKLTNPFPFCFPLFLK